MVLVEGQRDPYKNLKRRLAYCAGRSGCCKMGHHHACQEEDCNCFCHMEGW